ncbi:MAG: hypothetical protein ITG00_10015 [Flavobacterium sp.]|nr:hypothetical protein [Flavobacterium sp.]
MSVRNSVLSKLDPSVVVATVILIYTLLPFLLLCIYSVPLGDDFWYASGFRNHGMIGAQTSWYQEWSGRYMATFLISTFNPVSYGHLNLGFLHPLALFFGTVISLKFLIDTVIDYFKLPINRILSLRIILFFYLNYLPDLGESFYWMAGAYTYQVPVIFLFVYAGLLIRIFNKASIKSNVINILLAIICLAIILGSNEVLVVYLCFFNSIIALYLLVVARSSFIKFIPLLIVTAILSFFMIFAEGNFARAGLFEKPSFHLLKSGIHSLSRGMFVLFFWIPALMILLLSIRGFSEIKTLNVFLFEKLSNRRSLIIVIVASLILIVWMGFFPSIYATKWIPQRAYTPIFAIFTMVFIMMLIAILRHFPALVRINLLLSGDFRASAILQMLLIVTLSHNCNVMNAYVDLTSGKASSHYNQVMGTYDELKSTSSDTIYVKELAKRPLIMPIRWPQPHNQLANSIWEDYFGVESIELE